MPSVASSCCGMCTSMRLLLRGTSAACHAALKDLLNLPAEYAQLEEIQPDEHHGHRRGERRKERGCHRSHQDALECEEGDERDVRSGRREQPGTRARAPEVAPLA